MLFEGFWYVKLNKFIYQPGYLLFSQTVVQNSVDFDYKHKLDLFPSWKGFSMALVTVNKMTKITTNQTRAEKSCVKQKKEGDWDRRDEQRVK